ncbi:MAG TPA: hypothetical protein VH593_17935 [Ktedonobacteraceae bacterium]
MTIYATQRIWRKCCLCQEKSDDCYWHEPLKGFLCPRCTLHPQSHTIANATLVGRPLKCLPAFSLEFEVCSYGRSILEQALVLLKYQYKRTYDETVSDEYKSPIYTSIRSFRRPLTVLHDLRDLVDDHCGTHLHIACAHKGHLRVIQADVFSLLLDYMLNHQKQTIQFWGRFFGRYATAPNIDRYHCFNLESHYPTLEFRLPRFRTAEQYLRVIKYCRATVAYLDAALAEDQPTDSSTHCQPEQQKGGQKRRALSPDAMGQHVLALYKQHVKKLPEYESWLDEESIGDNVEDDELDDF